MRHKQYAKQTTGQGSALWTTLICLLLLLFSTIAAYASGGPAFRYGAVYTKGLIYGPGNKPIYVEYDDNGGIGSEIGEAVGDYEHARVMSSAQYRSFLTQLEFLKEAYSELVLVSKADYAAAEYHTVGGDLIKGANEPPRLASSTVTAPPAPAGPAPEHRPQPTDPAGVAH